MWPFSHAAPPPAPGPVDQLRNRDIFYDDRAVRARTRWTRLLIVFLRLLSLVCLARGLTEWGRILGFLGAEDAFETAETAAQVTMALYAVLNCVAAVGLWLTSAWGAVLWLTVTLCELLLPIIGGRPILAIGLAEIALLTLALFYVILTGLAARERAREH